MIHFNFNPRSRPMIFIQCPECGSIDIGQEREINGAIWCNSCKHRVENKEKDLQILMNGGGEIKAI